MMRIEARGLSDTGLTRRRNEDFFAIESHHDLYVVADGMGGHSHGEIASRILVESICEFIRRVDDPGPTTLPWDSRLQPHSNVFKAAILDAQRQMLGAIEENLALRGMGTTVVGLLVDGGVGAIAHVGDSRLYRSRNGDFELLTRDHTWVNEQVMAGYLSEEQARSHPQRNLVTRALGGEEQVDVDVLEVPIESGDVFLLCSDGLTGMLLDEEIQELLASGADLDDVCRSLVEAANDRGGADNVTVVVVAIEAVG